MSGRTSLGNPTGIIELKYQREQQAFLRALDQKTPLGRHAFNRLALFSGRGAGKTFVGAVGVTKKIVVPRSIGWVCGPSFTDIHDFIIPEVLRVIPASWIGNWSEQHYELELKNYAKVQFRSLDDPDKARGPNLDWAWIDEVCKVQELAWKTMLPAIFKAKGQAWVTTTPRSFDWAYQTFWLPALQGEPGFWAAKYKTCENPKYADAEGMAELAALKRSMDPLFYQQEMEADFVTFTGAIFGALIDSQILRTDAQIRAAFPDWPIIDPALVTYLAIDPGADHPFAGSVAVMTPIGLVCIAEYLERTRPIHEHVLGMHRMLGKFNPGQPFIPETWAIDKTQRQFAIELAQPPHHIYTTQAPNDVENGIRRVQAWLAQKQLWFLLPEAQPELGVPITVEQMRGYRWAENTTPTGEARKERVIKRNDDLCLVAGTLIETSDGPRAIEQVAVGTLVWTRDGLRRVTARVCSGVRPIVTLRCRDGRWLSGTGNHPILTDRASFERMDGLRYSDTLWGWSGLFDTGEASASIDTPSRLFARTASIGSRIVQIACAVCKHSIRKSGRRRMGRFLPAITSTIATTIRSITDYEIFKPNLVLSTSAITRRGGYFLQNVRPTSPRCDPWRACGTSPRRDAAGIVSTRVSFGNTSGRSGTAAITALHRSGRANVEACASVQGTAKPRGGGRFFATWKFASVGSVARRFRARSGLRPPRPVRGPVVSVGAIVSAGTAPVYNLQVEGTPEFFANGLLVHNCDCVRYMLMTGPQLMETDAAPSRGLRDLSQLDPLTRYEIEKLRALEHRGTHPGETPFFATESDLPGLVGATEDDVTAMGDFYR